MSLYRKPTKEQQKALSALWYRSADEREKHGYSYLSFRRSAFCLVADTCLMIPWCGMYVGIEQDGHCHT